MFHHSNKLRVGVSTLSLNRAPVNGLSLEILNELKESLQKIQNDGSTGMILTSSLSTVFCGGIDIMELYKSSKERITKFWTAFQETWITLYGLELPTVAAVNVIHSTLNGACIGNKVNYLVIEQFFFEGCEPCWRLPSSHIL